MKKIYIILLALIIGITGTTLYLLQSNIHNTEYYSVDSWTVSWTVKSGEYYSDIKTQHKTFIKEEDAKRFKDDINNKASFLGCWIKVGLKKN